MTTDPTAPAAPAPAPPSPRRRRPRQAPAGRVLATGAALAATGILVTIMGVGAPSATVGLVSQSPAVASGVAAPALESPPTTIVIVHRPAASAPAAPSAGRAIPAARPAPAAPPAPAATSTAS